MTRRGSAFAVLALLTMPGLMACSSGQEAPHPSAANDAVNLDATADELDRMANELENGAGR